MKFFSMEMNILIIEINELHSKFAPDQKLIYWEDRMAQKILWL